MSLWNLGMEPMPMRDGPQGAGRYSRGRERQSIADGHLAQRIDHVRETAAAMARLKPAERRALSLIGLGYSYREIGEITRWTYGKVSRSPAEGRMS
jgi:DNA-directed RNA polymerase specialized sigma24 family protein